MNREQLNDYIRENFTLDGGLAGRLIDAAIFYAESRFENVDDQRICLRDLLEPLGLTDAEINAINL